ncbi:hypothetical protein [Tenacibaculum aquimarinum]|uniref:hypothetical protein n=1 Tax=Tenacibaculum aquimarinum TaxID=2910675 RepID=UPI001F0A7271|nr:hypothetical protein [Tenacibaculum aquimarinum]MCH3885688.1 hypothetical protein [Tenacibaculum aquimarinum]
MFDKIFEKLNDYDRFKSNPNNLKLVEDFLIYIFFNDDREFAKKEVKKLREQVQTDKEFWDLFFTKYKFPNIFKSFLEINKISNISDVILTAANIKDRSKDIVGYSERDKELLQRFITYRKLREHDILKMVSHQLQIPKEKLIEEQLKINFFFTSKTNICKEFGVNKRTLNKWLEIVGLGSRFKGRKKLNFKEYEEIFTALFTSEYEDLNINDNLQAYKERIKRGLKFSKSKIATLTESDYKVQKENLKKFEYYHFTDVFPYSIATLLVEKMGEEIDF